jgi:hypothetical protein
MNANKYTIYYEGEPISYINPHLCEKQGLTDETIKLICETHSVKHGLLVDMENTEDVEALRELASQVEDVEYTLQELWGFERDSKYHRFWLLPKCSCPRLDNEDRYATGVSIIDTDCIIHGWRK